MRIVGQLVRYIRYKQLCTKRAVMYFNILVILNGKFHFLNVSLSALHIIASFVLNILVIMMESSAL